jgi:hypothetical protein
VKPTRQVSDLVAGLKHITALLEASGIDDLPAPVSLHVDLDVNFAAARDVERLRTVDLFAAVTGSDAGYEPGSTKYAGYETRLEESDASWQLRATALARRPDPVSELTAENARLREQIAAMSAVPEPAASAATPEHYHVGGAAGPAGENEARCACGITFAGFDTHAEATAMLDEHIARPALAVHAELDDGPTLEYSAEFVHGPAVADVLDPPHPDWRDDEDEAQSARDLAAERRRQDRLDGDDGPDTDYAFAHGPVLS